jgi:hypothetical protein
MRHKRHYMWTASSDLAVTTQQGDRRAQYWAFFTQDELALWHFMPLGQEDMKTASALCLARTPQPTSGSVQTRSKARGTESDEVSTIHPGYTYCMLRS